MTLAKALKMGKEGRIEEWVHQYLSQPHPPGNIGFSEGLKRIKRYWIGPVKMDLSAVIQTCGPGRTYRFHEGKRTWDLRIKENTEKLKNNEKPPPLIVEFKNDQLLISDGNHRYGALRAFGSDACWVVIWFSSKTEWQKYKREMEPKDSNNVLPDNRRGGVRKVDDGRAPARRPSRHGLP